MNTKPEKVNNLRFFLTESNNLKQDFLSTKTITVQFALLRSFLFYLYLNPCFFIFFCLFFFFCFCFLYLLFLVLSFILSYFFFLFFVNFIRSLLFVTSFFVNHLLLHATLITSHCFSVHRFFCF